MCRSDVSLLESLIPKQGVLTNVRTVTCDSS